jgi:hypothetical protein
MSNKSSLSRALAAGCILALGLFLGSVDLVSAVACTEGGDETTRTVSGTSCTFSENVVGVDGGAVSVGASSTLLVGANQVLVYGTSLTLPSTSSISLNSTASIKKGKIFVTDADGDGYRLNSATDAVFSTASSYVGKVRRSAATSGFDANEADACKADNTAVGGNPGLCEYCVNGSTYIAAAGTDPRGQCTFVGWNGCTNLCVKSTTVADNCSGASVSGASTCQTSTANVASGKICSGGSEVVGACAVGYTCFGDGHCCYTDIYGTTCAW